MPYLAFDLDAKKKVGPCARAVGVDPGVIAWGLLELWEHVWLSKSASVNEMVLDGCFGPNARMREALVTYDFLEQVPDGYRVKGAERYLRVTESRVQAGKARAAGAGRSAGRFASATSTLPAHAGEPTSTSPALTPSTEHRAPKLLPSEVVGPPPAKAVVEPPAIKASTPATTFFVWAQEKRRAAGLVREKPPNLSHLASWYSEAISELRGNEERLRESFLSFGDDKHWQQAKPPLPFNAFMTQWDRYAPRDPRSPG